MAQGEAGWYRIRPVAGGLQCYVAVSVGRLVDGVHDIEDVVCHRGVDPRTASVAQRVRHVGHTDASTALRVTQRHLFPISAAALDSYRAAERVGIGDAEGAFCAVDFQPGDFGCPHVEAGDYRSDSPVFEIECPRDVC